MRILMIAPPGEGPTHAGASQTFTAKKIVLDTGSGATFTMDGDKITDASFVGSGCCISKASASLLTDNVKGKSKAEVKKMFDLVREMVTSGKVNGDVGKLAVFAGVYKYPARVKCAILSWHALMAALKGEGQQPVSTESEST